MDPVRTGPDTDGLGIPNSPTQQSHICTAVCMRAYAALIRKFHVLAST